MRSSLVSELVDWASVHPELDHAHRQNHRSWQCMGQRILTIQRTGGGLAVRAGIHYSLEDAGGEKLEVSAKRPMTESDLGRLRAAASAGIDERLSGGFHKPDEHWLQAVLRKDPRVLGIEQPALREVPAWRPVGESKAASGWSRGFVDLVGLDGHGDVRIVETKLGTNADPLVVLQGLDYYIWAEAYRDVLMGRLGADTRSGNGSDGGSARFVIHYVFGADVDGRVKVSEYARATAAALTVPWRSQTVSSWFDGEAKAELHLDGQLAPPR